MGSILMAATAVCGAMLFWTYYHLTVPAYDERAPSFRALFFNVQGGNSEFSDRIVSAATQLDPDIVVFAEAAAVLPSIDRLREDFNFVSSCTAEQCELLIATNLDVRRFWQLQLNPAWPERYAVLEFDTPDGGSAFLAATHLVKPWMSGIAEPEIALLKAQLNWFDGPVVALGDFNMAPWSRPMRQLLGETGFHGIRGQPATWPESSRLFRIPLDQILVRGDISVSSIMPFGDGMNSNHVGFVANVAFPPPSE
jgi:endonuclease/exonuclease/phosphatase (EEP) superfamily protein YafD